MLFKNKGGIKLADINTVKIGKKLRSLREKFGYTQQQIANTLSIDRSTYSYYETEKTTPDLSTLVVLANIFAVTVDELLQPDDESAPVMLHDRGAERKNISAGPLPKVGTNQSHIYDLSKGEKQIICFYRSMSPTQQQELLENAAAIARREQDRRKEGRGRKRKTADEE